MICGYPHKIMTASPDHWPSSLPLISRIPATVATAGAAPRSRVVLTTSPAATAVVHPHGSRSNRDPVIYTDAFPPVLDQSRIEKIPQVPGRPGLGDGQNPHDVGHTKFFPSMSNQRIFSRVLSARALKNCHDETHLASSFGLTRRSDDSSTFFDPQLWVCSQKGLSFAFPSTVSFGLATPGGTRRRAMNNEFTFS